MTGIGEAAGVAAALPHVIALAQYIQGLINERRKKQEISAARVLAASKSLVISMRLLRERLEEIRRDLGRLKLDKSDESEKLRDEIVTKYSAFIGTEQIMPDIEDNVEKLRIYLGIPDKHETKKEQEEIINEHKKFIETMKHAPDFYKEPLTVILDEGVKIIKLKPIISHRELEIFQDKGGFDEFIDMIKYTEKKEEISYAINHTDEIIKKVWSVDISKAGKKYSRLQEIVQDHYPGLPLPPRLGV